MQMEALEAIVVLAIVPSEASEEVLAKEIGLIGQIEGAQRA